jgi:hypothetical protein
MAPQLLRHLHLPRQQIHAVPSRDTSRLLQNGMISQLAFSPLILCVDDRKASRAAMVRKAIVEYSHELFIHWKSHDVLIHD